MVNRPEQVTPKVNTKPKSKGQNRTKECTQKDRGCSIPGQPVGVDQDVGQDYSFGKFEEVYEVIGNSLSRIPPGKE